MKSMKRLLLLFLIISMVLPVSAQDDELTIVTSTTILADVVQNVAGDAAAVTSLVPLDADPHSFEPTPREVVTLAEADVVFTNGALFEEGLLETIENADADINIVRASTCVHILPFGGHDHDEEGEEHHDEDEEHHDEEGEAAHMMEDLCAQHHTELGEEHEHEGLGMLHQLDCGDGHAHEEDGEEHEHEEGSCDPHVWTDPHNVMLWTLLIRDTLIELDPANAETYTQNAASYLAELEALETELDALVATLPEDNRLLITNHDAFGYLAHRYSFDVIGVIIPGGSTVAEPSAREIATLIDTVNEAGVNAIFAESTVNDDIAQQIADETGAEVYILYSGSLSEGEPAGTYLDYMRYNIMTLVEGLQG
jgi:ABC-type Zn uptake system ZnuABC Zn-binding protein ZnuA